MDAHFFLAGRCEGDRVPVTDELLHEFETRWGVRLPNSYVDLLRVQNGGLPRRRLFVRNDHTEYVLEELAGIGPDQHGGRDLLESVGAWTSHNPEGNEIDVEIPSAVIPFCGDGHDYLALDYRESGPAGEPTVVSVCCDETPIMYFLVARTFAEFADGLLRYDQDYYFGFLGVGTASDSLVNSLEKVFKVQAERRVEDGCVEYEFRHATWRTRPVLTLMPNVDYACVYDHESDEMCKRPAGLYFPEHPECTWMLKGSIPDDVLAELLAVLKRQSFEFILLHQPREDLNPPPSRSSGPPKLHELPDASIELPAGFQGPAMMIRAGCDPEVEFETFMFSGDFPLLLDEGQLKVDGKPFGVVKRGDFIRVVSPNEVYVNGEPRGGTVRPARSLIDKVVRLWNSLFGT